MIQSTSNERIKQLAKLKQKKYRMQTRQFIAEGEHLVEEAAKQGIVLEVFYTDKTKIPQNYHGVCTEVSSPVLEKLAFSKTPQKIIALCSFVEKTFDFGQMQRLFLLDGLQDPGNIGTIIRTALAMDFDGVLLSEDSVDLYHDKLLRACQGANFHLPIMQADLEKAIAQLQQHQFKVYATALHEAKSIKSYISEPKMAFVLGNEGNGVKASTIRKCDGAMYIPIQKAESLNVAIAAGMIAYQFTLI